MICSKCNNDFTEAEIQESHDVPCYLFDGKFRNERKNQADKFPRHWLCLSCHEDYETELKLIFRDVALDFSNKWFGGKNE